MHYVLVWWFKEVITPKLKGYAGLVVYAGRLCATKARTCGMIPNKYSHAV